MLVEVVVVKEIKMPSLSPCLDGTPPRSITHCAGCLDTTTLYVYSKRIAWGSDESEEIVGVGKSEAHISVSVIRVSLSSSWNPAYFWPNQGYLLSCVGFFLGQLKRDPVS